jgi:hypothetical protein
MFKKYQRKSGLGIIVILILFISLVLTVNNGSSQQITEMGMTVSSDSITVGDDFTVTVYIDPTEAIGGWLIYFINFSAGLAQANQILPGPEWNVDTFDQGEIENNIGSIKNIQTWKTENYPNSTHPACEVSFTALESGECFFNITKVEISNESFELIQVNTIAASITISEDDNGGGGNGGGGGGSNIPPIADASASETSGFIGVNISFDGSLSYDSDGSIIVWNWDFGDGETGTGETIQHRYYNEDVYMVTLTVVDNQGDDDSDTIDVNISKGPNYPPTKPEIFGPTEGTVNNPYEYNATATDEDNDTLSYIFNWGDGESTKTEYLPIGETTTQTHSWTEAGRYSITVEATDNQTYSQITELIVFIDAIKVGDIGYFTDDDGDETYDTFHSNDDEITTSLGQDTNGSYLVDSDDDGEWDYIYNSDMDTLEEYIEKDEKKSIPSIIILGILVIIILIIIAFLVFIKKIRKND